MPEICRNTDCTGCGACVSVCPKGAVLLKEGRLGALNSSVDTERCIDCGLCTKVCPVTSPVSLTKPRKSYASYAYSSQERTTSSSGGAAAVLTEYVIKKGGVVYGCAMQSGMKIGHIRVDNPADAVLLKGSKYVYSTIDKVLPHIKEDVKAGRNVLFVGLPCQVAAVINVIGASDNLITMDMCCHGAPSQRVLSEHLAYLGWPNSDKVSFRKKQPSGIEYAFTLYDRQGKCTYDHVAQKDYYMTGFLSGLFMRESCFNCPFARPERCADITLADHWAMGMSEDPEMVISKGISTVLVNTEKGARLFSQAQSLLVYEERPMPEALRNGQFIEPSRKPESYDEFSEAYLLEGYAKACDRYLPSLQRKMLIHELKSRYYKSPIRQYIRKLLKK